MNFNTHELSDQLNVYVESIFHFKGFIPDHALERVVPTGHIYLLIELDGMMRHTFDNDSLEPNANYQHVWLSGMHKKYITISAHENSEMLVIQFKAAGAYPFIHQPINKFNEVIVAADSIFGKEIMQLRKKCLTAKESVDKFALVEAWLIGRLDETRKPSAELLSVLEKLQVEDASRHQGIIDTYPYTQKHLIDQFKKYVGLTPKYYQRILRFNDILQQIQHQKQISWPDVAIQCGYSDQSHFIKEFRHFSGFNPSEFLQHEFQSDEANFFPLDK